MISSEIMILGDQESFVKVLHCLGKPAFKKNDMKDTVVFTFEEDEELAMLEHWSQMTRVFDVEWLAGFNSISYDVPYVYQRAKLHGSLDIFRNLSRFQALPHDRLQRGSRRYKECLPRERLQNGKGLNNEMPQIDLPGVIQFDALKVIKLLEKLSTYSLKEVAKELLTADMQKKDLPHSMISPYFAAGPEYQRKLAIYCIYDTRVTVAVMVKRFLLGHAIEVARASWTSITQQMLQGAQIKTWNLICKTAHRDGWILDELARQKVQQMHGLEIEPLPRYLRKFAKHDAEGMSFKEIASLRKEKKYDGAFVLDPVIGLYDSIYTNTFDFASLYPSIIIAYNLCFSTWIEHRYDKETNEIWFPYFDKSFAERSKDKYCVWWGDKPRPPASETQGKTLILVCEDKNSGHTDCFVQDIPSLLPGILRALTAMRKGVKNEMKEAKKRGDTFQVSVLDSRQGAIKILANASYGFCGATAGFFGFIAIAIVTCGMGRLAILLTKHIVETVFGGFVRYGDTDSVFCQFPNLENQPGKTRQEIFEIIKAHCKKACEYISERLPKPMLLDYEKSFDRWVLLKKKQYAGYIIYPDPKFLMKGLAPVRRDCCPIAAECGKSTLENVLNHSREPEVLLAPLKKALAEIENPNISLTRLEKTVAKKAIYKNGGDRLIQKHLFDKIKAQSGVEVETGSRIGYIITLPNRGKKAIRGKDDKIYKDGEATTTCMDEGILADRAYYVEKQIRVPLLRYLSQTSVGPQVNRLCQATLDKIWVQTSKNTLINSYFKRKLN
jgi:DNA polymerase delta subunit 1